MVTAGEAGGFGSGWPALALVTGALLVLGSLQPTVIRCGPGTGDVGRKLRSDLSVLAEGCEEFLDVHGRYPRGLEELYQPDASGRTLLKGRKPPRDPWRREYVYVPPSERAAELLVYTLGHDGERGGDGQDADVSNHGWGPEARIGERPRTIR